MPAGKYLYRVLRDDEDPNEGLSARNPEETNAKVSSHVNGLKKSPYISTTASEKAAEAFYWLAVKRWQKKTKTKDEKKFTVVKIDKDKLLEGKEKVEVFDLSDKEVRDKELAGNIKLQNYAAKYEEVLVKGFIPANCIEEVKLGALSDYESSSEGYSQDDYTADGMDDLVRGTESMKLQQ